MLVIVDKELTVLVIVDKEFTVLSMHCRQGVDSVGHAL